MDGIVDLATYRDKRNRGIDVASAITAGTAEAHADLMTNEHDVNERIAIMREQAMDAVNRVAPS